MKMDVKEGRERRNFGGINGFGEQTSDETGGGKAGDVGIQEGGEGTRPPVYVRHRLSDPEHMGLKEMQEHGENMPPNLWQRLKATKTNRRPTLTTCKDVHVHTLKGLEECEIWRRC
jgi:hypothetical protein